MTYKETEKPRGLSGRNEYRWLGPHHRFTSGEPGCGVHHLGDTSILDVMERLPGWYGRYFHSPSMTFAHYDFSCGASIHEHSHPQEEVYEVIEGELEITIDGQTHVVRPGLVAIVPSGVLHFVKALTDGRAIIVDYPRRHL